MHWVVLLLAFIASNSFAAEEIGKDFSFQNFDGKKIQDTTYIDCKFNHATFKGAQLSNVTFIKSTLIDANFNHSKLNKVTFNQSNLGGSKFQHSIVNGLDIWTGRAPKVSFWQAKLLGISIQGSYLLALDLSQTTIQSLLIEGSYLEDAFIRPTTVANAAIKSPFYKLATISAEIPVTDHQKTEFTLLEDVVVKKAPEISESCLKKYPLNKNRSNGVKMLTNGATFGGCFNSCLKEQSFEIGLNLNNWPEHLRKDLWLEIVTNKEAGVVKANVAFETQGPSLFIKPKAEDKQLDFTLDSKDEFGIYEIRLVLRSNK